MKRYYTLFVIFIALSSVLHVANAQDAETWMPDANLRNAVRDALDLADDDPLTQAALADLKKLHAQKSNIASLTGLEHATALKTLTIFQNNISDLTPLANLTSLKNLRIGRNNISDVTPLTNLTALTHLALQRNDISDVTPLTNLVKLKWLRLARNSITDTSPLVTLPKLTDVDIDIPDIVADTALAVAVRSALSLASNARVSPAVMASLERLDTSSYGISDLSGLEYATNLIQLGLGGHSLTAIGVLSGLTELIQLDVSDNSLSDISALAGLTKLTWLSLSDNSLSDISALSQLTALTLLYLANNEISDVSALESLVNLETLTLSGNAADLDASSLSSLPNLTDVDVSLAANTDTEGDDVDVETPEPVENSDREIETLWMPDEELRAIVRAILELDDDMPLTRLAMRDLTALIEPESGIIDLTGLEYATNLQTLGLEDSNIIDVSALSGLTALTELRLSGNDITDVSTLSELENLEILTLRGNPIEDASLLTGLARNIDIEVPDLIPDNALAKKVRETLALAANDRITRKDMRSLTTLHEGSGAVKDIAGLEYATNLTDLLLTNSPIKVITRLAALTQLQSLDIGNADGH